MHDFWRAEDPNQKMNDMTHFMKNLALAGSTVVLMGIEEPRPHSLQLPKQTRLEKVVSTTKKRLAA